MSLENLLKTRQLQAHEPTRAAVQRLLQAVARNIADARVEEISAENRFDAAYKAIMQCAMVALWANGYRTSTSQPGHHQVAIQALNKTIGLEQSTVIVLDALRKQRNISDYEGNPISDQTVIECIKQAEQLYSRVAAWITSKRPDLAGTGGELMNPTSTAGRADPAEFRAILDKVSQRAPLDGDA